MSGYLEGVLVVLAINVILAYAAFLPIVAGQLNLGIAGFMATGAYLSAYLTNAHGWLPQPAALAATVLTAALGLVVAFPILRTRGIYLALATFAFGQVVVAMILNLDVVGGASGYPVSANLGFPAIAAAAAIVFVAVYCLFHTRFGLSVTAVSDDELVADQMGLSVRGLQTAAFTIGAAEVSSNAMAVGCVTLAMVCGAMCSGLYWALASAIAPSNCTASAGSLANFGSYIGGAITPTATGFIVQATGSFTPAVLLGGGIALLSALSYLVLVKNESLDFSQLDAKLAPNPAIG